MPRPRGPPEQLKGIQTVMGNGDGWALLTSKPLSDLASVCKHYGFHGVLSLYIYIHTHIYSYSVITLPGTAKESVEYICSIYIYVYIILSCHIRNTTAVLNCYIDDY